MVYTYVLASILLCLSTLIRAKNYVHDKSFTPNVILRGTVQNFSAGCIERSSVLLNGTSPGPEVRIRAGKTTWIRVYNDMNDRNLTVVSKENYQRLDPRLNY